MADQPERFAEQRIKAQVQAFAGGAGKTHIDLPTFYHVPDIRAVGIHQFHIDIGPRLQKLSQSLRQQRHRNRWHRGQPQPPGKCPGMGRNRLHRAVIVPQQDNPRVAHQQAKLGKRLFAVGLK